MTQTHKLENWIRAIGNGDRDALCRLYQSTDAAVYGYALSILKHPADAEDAMQDTYLALWNDAKNYRPQGKPMAWILTVTRNVCLKQIRQKKWTVPLSDAERYFGTHADPADAMLLKLCLQNLDDEEREIVVLHAVAGMKHRQIGQYLGLKTGTVLSKYHRTIQKLRKML